MHPSDRTRIGQFEGEVRKHYLAQNFHEAISTARTLIAIYDQSSDQDSAWGEVPYMTAKIVLYRMISGLSSPNQHVDELRLLAKEIRGRGGRLTGKLYDDPREPVFNKYRVDVWFTPAEDFHEGTAIKVRNTKIDSTLACSDDEKRGYAREGIEYLLFELAKISENDQFFNIECVYVDKVATEREALEFINDTSSNFTPGSAQHYTATNCRPV